MTTETIALDCPRCHESTKGLPMSIVISVDGPYRKLYCCNCKHLVHVKVV